MSFINRLKAGRPGCAEQKLDWVRNPHNVELIGDDDSKDAQDIPAKETDKEAVKTNYKTENNTTAKHGKV